MAKRMTKTFRIFGRVIDRATGRGIAGLRVEAWDKSLICIAPVGSAATNVKGVFRIEFMESHFKELFQDRQPELFFKVFRDDRLIRSTEDSVLWNVGAGETPITIEVDVAGAGGQEPDGQSGPPVVRGYVRQMDGSPVSGVVVRAFDKDLRFEQPLGQCQTDGRGFYEIRYSPNQFHKPEKSSANLIVKAFADDSLLATSPVMFSAPPEANVDLTIPVEILQPATQFDKIARAVAPLFEGLNVEDLEEDQQHQDLSFLSGRTGFEKSALARFVVAHKLAQHAIQAEFWFALLGGSFFQFVENQSLADQSATILDSLSSLDATIVRKALIRSLNQKEIPETLREKVAGWVEAFLQFAVSQSVGEATRPTFVKLALDHARISGAKKQEKFARLFNEYKAFTPELLSALEKDESFSSDEIADLHTSFCLAELTQDDFSLVKMLKEEFDVRRPEKIRTLAKRSEDNWVKWVTDKHAASEIKLPVEVGEIAGLPKLPEAEIYGKTLERQFREAFPTAAFAGGLERAVSNGGVHGLRHAETLASFLEHHEDFELLTTPVDNFLKSSIRPGFEALAKDESFRLETKAVQRVFKLVPTFEATDALLADDLHSAQKVYRMGETEFIRRFGGHPGFTPETARLAWNRAADTHAAVLTVIADLKALEAEALPLALRNNNEALSTFPNWDNLFQTGDLCECEHCRSVLSPAAYFTDLLMFLKDRETYTGKGKVKDVLFRRRPDLGYLELNCENALTTLPYVDVVCEVLEHVVAAGENDVELAGFGVMPDESDAAKATVAAALSANSINIGTEFTLSQVDPADPNRWVVHGDDATYLLKKKVTPNFFAELLPNTKAGSEELRAYPAYVNPKAYEKLRTRKYPLALPLDLFPEGDARRGEQRARSFALPFDLFAEEVRAAFQKCNLQRWDLMRTLRGSAAPNNPTESDIAAEYFGISTDSGAAIDEKRLILMAKPTDADQKIFWGETAIPGNLSNVKLFLQKTGLEFNDLLALLDLKFINPTGDIAVQRSDPSCDTDKMVLQVLDAPKLDRIHRFLRLWRKMKDWKMWELDLVIRHSCIGAMTDSNGALDEVFLTNLLYFSRLRNKLGVKTTVEQVCALFGSLNTVTHFTKLHGIRDNALYQNLFLNRRLTNPLDLIFEIDPTNNKIKSLTDPNTGLPLPLPKLSDHHPVILAALGIRETDLVLLKELPKASDGMRYITDDLTLTNLSFLWRHAWLSKLMKFKVEEWEIVLKIFHQDILHFANPKDAWEFVERIDHLKAAGFTPDELNWLLAADHSAKAAVKETDATRFLAALRKELQGIQDEYDPAHYDFLTAATDEEQLVGLLTTLLQKLNRDEAAVNVFLKTLRGSVLLETNVQGLPTGFTFPPAIAAAPHHIPIQYDEWNKLFRFPGLMTEAQRESLLNDALPALATLFESGRIEANAQGLPPGFVFPPAITGAPNHIPIQYDESNYMFRLNGLMTDVQRGILLNDASLAAVVKDPIYRSAIEDLFQQSVKVVNNYRSAVEDLFQQSLKAVTDYLSMERDVALPGAFIFPAAITGAPHAIPIRCGQVLRFNGVMTAVQHNTLLTDPALSAVTGIPAYREAIDILFQSPGMATVTGLPAGFTFPGAITGAPNNIPIRIEQTLCFIGVMAAAQHTTLLSDPSLAAVTGIAAYREAIEEFFIEPHLTVKFFEPVFTAPLEALPLAVDFKVQLSTDLAAKISYDTEQQLLRFTGIMSKEEKKALDDLVPSTEVAYRTAVESLATQPQTILPPDKRVWLTDNDLDVTLAISNTFAKRLGNAAPKALVYLSKTLAENAVVQQCSTQLGLTEAVTRRLFDGFTVMPPIPPEPQKTTLLIHLVRAFADTTIVVDYATPTIKPTFDGWYWASRVATILKKWKITLAELKKVTALTAGAQLLDFLTLPLDGTETIAPLDGFLRTSRLMRLRDTLPETDYTLLELLTKLKKGAYSAALVANVQDLPAGFAFPVAITSASNCIPIQYDEPHHVFCFTGLMSTSQRTILLNDVSLAAVTGNSVYRNAIEELYQLALTSEFVTDVQRLNDAWLAADVAALTASLDLAYPADYLLAENWERLRRTFYFIDNLNASADRVKTFAAAAMTPDHARTLKELLRSKFGAETWLTLSAEIQDSLRERKRDALSTYLLTHHNPADPPTGKWENTNDLYAYYLLDVEMCSGQLTSRLVQGAGSVQLFVQRCFMGLEPDVEVKADGADGDSAWRWWKWMRKYRVWEANRKVFLWPENWIEPELRKDKSSFFKDLENELLQNEINPYTVETAFLNYLEKLDGVAQLEIAGFYQEDDADNTIVHVFGRTTGAEPHLYYYRRYDYRQWTPWEKVELDIQGDYLIPAVVNKRLFLFWPVFTEVPDEQGNIIGAIPNSGDKVPETYKKLKLQLAVSEYRQGKWTPRKISKDYYEWGGRVGEIDKSHFRFWPVDRSAIDGRFGIIFDGGSFEIFGCKGVPEKTDLRGSFQHAIRPDLSSTGSDTTFMKWVELQPEERHDEPQNDFTLVSFNRAESDPTVLRETPWIFKMTPPWHLSYLDRLWFDGNLARLPDFQTGVNNVANAPPMAYYMSSAPPRLPIGAWLPFFYNDKKRSFFVLPSFRRYNKGPVIEGRSIRNYYREIKRGFLQWERAYEKQVKTWLDGIDLSTLTPDQRNQWEQFFFSQAFPEVSPPPYTDKQFKGLAQRWFMRFFHYCLGAVSLLLFQFRQYHFKSFYHPFVCDFASLVYNPLKGIPALMSRETQLKITEFSFQQTYQPTDRVVEDVFSVFSWGDIIDLSSLAMKLKQQSDKVSTFLHGKLSHAALQALANYQGSSSDPGPLQANLVQDLNMIIGGGLIFDAQRFAGVKLRQETQLLLTRKQQGENLIHLNRLLLDDAYPLEISSNLQDSYPKEVVDFTPDGAYSPYNWELFFHAPLLIANSLSKNQRFEEARDWYHFLFNPLGVESPIPGGSPMSKYWITKPFFETTDPQYVQQRIDNILRMLAGDTSVPGYSAQAKKDLEDQVLDWRTNPFEPHRIANYRTVAYQKTVVMKYLDNLIAWGDYLFRQDSMESINEATQLYILAAEILGPRPKIIPPQTKPPVESFNELEKVFDEGKNRFGNPLVELENLVPVMPGSGLNDGDVAPLPMLYFCIPQNDKLLGYWDTVADRLYKIRHCMNIEGMVRQLALFEPPIDPAALVKAVAGGLDISSALADLNAPLPLYHFNVMLQKANEVCNDVKALGGALLAALEKKDVEALGLLRQSQEIHLLEAVKAVRDKQIEEAKENLAGVKRSKELAEVKKKYYESRDFMNVGEVAAAGLNSLSLVSHTAGTIADVLAGTMFLIPDFHIGGSGFGGSPHFTAKTGGTHVGKAMERGANGLYNLATILDKSAGIATTIASYQRRKEEWDFQKDLAVKELAQIDRQITAAELRIAIAEKELDNHVLQIENAKVTDAFMRSKYTNQELYQWQVGQISGVYFQSYKLAYDLAKRAERCFRFELGLQDSSYINFGYWDSLKKGLLSGEKLQYDLRRLEAAYLEQDRREFELTKHVSLALGDPLALVKLRETGRCFFRLPEEIFDLDYPGHYFRRMKSVSLTLPCVVGPYTTISCTLRLLKNSIRVNTANGDNGYPRNTDDAGLPADDLRFVENNIPVKAMAASSAQNDSGVFELSFRDERYLPFEGAGAISEWSLELFSDLPANNPDPANPDFGRPLRQFDYGSISDAVLHVRYTAREDAGAFKNGAVTHLREYFSEDEATPSLLMLNLRHDFPTQWSRFLNPENPANGNVFEFEMSPVLFPMRDDGKTLKINTLYFLARCTDVGNYSVTLTPPLPAGANSMALAKSNQYGGLHFSQKDVAIEIVPTSPQAEWSIKVTRPGGGDLIEDPVKKVMEVEDVILVLGYECQ